MNKSTIIVCVRLLAIFCFVQSYSSSILLLASNHWSNSLGIYVSAILFMSIVPVALWLVAPILASLNFMGSEILDNSKSLVVCDLLSVGIFLLGIYLLPDALIGLLGSVVEMLTPRPEFTGAELWQYSSSTRKGLIFAITRLFLSLFFIFGSKKVVSHYQKYGNNG